MKYKRIAVLLSGGIDSATCLGMAVDNVGKDNVVAINMFYGQKHKKEIECARKLAEHYGVKYLELSVDSVMQFSNCALLDHSTQEIKQGTYADQKSEGEVNTYVPFRNGLFLSIATSIALSFDCDAVIYGAHSDDIAGNAYPDCSLSFVDAMNEAIDEGSGHKVGLIVPFVDKTKADVVKKGLELKVPYELTWSCYLGEEKPCGKCATCIDRRKAFELNGVGDPIEQD